MSNKIQTVINRINKLSKIQTPHGILNNIEGWAEEVIRLRSELKGLVKDETEKHGNISFFSSKKKEYIFIKDKGCFFIKKSPTRRQSSSAESFCESAIELILNKDLKYLFLSMKCLQVLK